MKDYRVMVTVKNNRLLSAIEEAGFASVSEFCKEFGISDTEVGKYINMKKSPLTASGNMSKTASKIIDALNCSIDDIFSEDQIWQPLEKNKSRIDLDREDINDVLGLGFTELMEVEHENYLLPQYVKSVLDSVGLTDKQSKVIEMRFGINGKESDIDDIAKKLDVSRERIYQIERRALRKIRQSDISEQLLSDYY